MNQSLFEKPLLVLAMDTSTDMLACAVAHWTPDADGLGAQVEVLASGDHLCRRQSQNIYVLPHLYPNYLPPKYMLLYISDITKSSSFYIIF